MATSAGPTFPTAATGNTNTVGGGTHAWTNPGNILANDGNNATATVTAVIKTASNVSINLFIAFIFKFKSNCLKLYPCNYFFVTP